MQEPNPDFCQLFYTGKKDAQWKGYGIKSIFNFLNGIKISRSKKTKFYEAFDRNSANFSDGLISTAVVEAATKSLKNNSNWQKINLK